MTLLPAPAIYCLASEYARLSPEQISTAIHGLPDPSPLPDDWTRP